MDTQASLSALPDSVLRRIAAHLDISAVNNWRTLVALMPQYTEKDANAFAQLANKKKPSSPSMALLHDLQSRGCTISELSRLANDAKLGIIRDILYEHCTTVGIDVRGMYGPAKSFQTSSLPPPPLPQEQSPSKGLTESSVKKNLVQLSYCVLRDVTKQFDQTPYHKGGHKLGEGGFGEVFYCRVKLSGDKQETLAVKVLNKLETSNDNAVRMKHYENEVDILSTLFHECLLPLLGFSCDGPDLCLLYPFMPHGSLDRHVSSIYVLSPSQRMTVATDVARALAYMHHGTAHKVVIHRDVKSANILLTQEWRGRLGDFGVVRFQPSTDTIATTQVVGTMVYMSPECAQGQVTPASDVYAFGVVLYELLTGLPAEQADDSGTDLLSAVEDNEDGPQNMILGHWIRGAEVWQLAEQCTQHQHRKRPTSDKVAAALEKLQFD